MLSARQTVRRPEDEPAGRTPPETATDALDLPSGYYDPDSAAYDGSVDADVLATSTGDEALEDRELVTV
jgi:hypothetical protein